MKSLDKEKGRISSTGLLVQVARTTYILVQNQFLQLPFKFPPIRRIVKIHLSVMALYLGTETCNIKSTVVKVRLRLQIIKIYNT